MAICPCWLKLMSVLGAKRNRACNPDDGLVMLLSIAAVWRGPRAVVHSGLGVTWSFVSDLCRGERPAGLSKPRSIPIRPASRRVYSSVGRAADS